MTNNSKVAMGRSPIQKHDVTPIYDVPMHNFKGSVHVLVTHVKRCHFVMVRLNAHCIHCITS